MIPLVEVQTGTQRNEGRREVLRRVALSEKTWVRVDFLAMKVVVGKRVWRMEVAFLRAVLVRMFMFADTMQIVVANERCV